MSEPVKPQMNIMFKALSGTLSPQDVRMIQIKACWIKVIDRLVPNIKGHSFPIELDNQKILRIICDTPALAFNLSFIKKDILSSLNKELKTSIKKLDILVRNIKEAEARQTAQFQEIKEEALNENTDEIDIAHSNWLAKDIADENLRQKFIKLDKTAKYIIRRQLTQGAVLCSECGFPAPLGKKICTLCQLELDEAVNSEIIRCLNQECWCTLEDINKKLLSSGLPAADREIYVNIKKKLQSQRRQEIWSELRQNPEGSELSSGLRSKMVELACMVSGRHINQLNDKILLKALRPAMAAVYNSNRVHHYVRTDQK